MGRKKDRFGEILLYMALVVLLFMCSYIVGFRLLNPTYTETQVLFHNWYIILSALVFLGATMYVQFMRKKK